MKETIFKASERGQADFGWLKANYSFSFANYHDSRKMHFGLLRVLNDDYIEAGMGFGTHPHDNMEIITIPLEGDLEHRDSMGNHGIIRHGDVQVMSAGTGIQHSEFNHNKDKALKLFQIWIFPHTKNVQPRYEQMTLNVADRKNKFQTVVSPIPASEGLGIHQNAYIRIGDFESEQVCDYNVSRKQNGVYLMVIKGNITVGVHTLNTRDAIGISDAEKLSIRMNERSELLLLEVPMY